MNEDCKEREFTFQATFYVLASLRPKADKEADEGGKANGFSPPCYGLSISDMFTFL